MTVFDKQCAEISAWLMRQKLILCIPKKGSPYLIRKRDSSVPMQPSSKLLEVEQLPTSG